MVHIKPTKDAKDIGHGFKVKYMCQVAKRYMWLWYAKHTGFRYVNGKGRQCNRWKIHRIYLGSLLKRFNDPPLTGNDFNDLRVSKWWFATRKEAQQFIKDKKIDKSFNG